MQRKEVLTALRDLTLPDGRSLLASGHVQDVLVEVHREGAHVAVLVDPEWEAGPVPPEVVDAVQRRLQGLPGVASARVVARPKELAARAAAFRRPAPPAQLPAASRVVAVVSAKGGVGKSTVTVNLAASLARRGQRTAVLDLDLYGFSVPDLLQLQGRPTLVEGKMAAPMAHGVKVMSLAFFVRENAPVAWRGPMLGKAIRQFVTDTRWEEEDFVLLDLPPGTGDVLMDVLADFPQAAFLVVTTPDPWAAKVAERAGALVRKLGHPVLGVVENLAYAVCPGCGEELPLFGRGGGEAMAAALKTEILARIPWSPPLPEGEGAVQPPTSPAGLRYAALAEAVERASAALARREEVSP